jgi:hypothetical protein
MVGVTAQVKTRIKGLSWRAVMAYSARSRKRKAERTLAWMNERSVLDVLLVGTMGDERAGSSIHTNAGIIENRIAARYPIKMSINIEHANTSYPFMIADARDMPFEDGYVDFALANAIIEHVGQEDDQRKMVEEMTRVARCWIITTPNRWFPVESHTATLFLHWLPSWRKKMIWNFTRILSKREFRNLLPKDADIHGSVWSSTFTATYVKPP